MTPPRYSNGKSGRLRGVKMTVCVEDWSDLEPNGSHDGVERAYVVSRRVQKERRSPPLLFLPKLSHRYSHFYSPNSFNRLSTIETSGLILGLHSIIIMALLTLLIAALLAPFVFAVPKPDDSVSSVSDASSYQYRCPVQLLLACCNSTGGTSVGYGDIDPTGCKSSPSWTLPRIRPRPITLTHSGTNAVYNGKVAQSFGNCNSPQVGYCCLARVGPTCPSLTHDLCLCCDGKSGSNYVGCYTAGVFSG